VLAVELPAGEKASRCSCRSREAFRTACAGLCGVLKRHELVCVMCLLLTSDCGCLAFWGRKAGCLGVVWVKVLRHVHQGMGQVRISGQGRCRWRCAGGDVQVALCTLCDVGSDD
jgi:hypothetical protein